MQKILSDEEKKTIYEEVREILSEELGVALDKINPETRIIDDLGGDSLIYLEMIEEFKKKYKFSLEVRVIGQYILAHPVYTVREVANAVYDIIERGEDLIARKEEETEGEELAGGVELA
ncbi:MAG: phosphopantetheine-binding protein [bacterium]